MSFNMSDRDVRKIWYNVCKKNKVGVYYSGSMFSYFKKRSVVKLLKRCGIPNPEKFLRSRTVFVCLGKQKIIMTHFRLSSTQVSPFKKMKILFHEMDHEHYAKTKGLPVWYREYVLDKGHRAMIETRGKLADADCCAYFGKSILSADAVFIQAWADVYDLDKGHIEQSKKQYNRGLMKIEQGMPATFSSQRIIRELKLAGF